MIECPLEVLCEKRSFTQARPSAACLSGPEVEVSPPCADVQDGDGLDLSNIAAVRLDVGPSWGSSKGRIVIDELMLTNDPP